MVGLILPIIKIPTLRQGSRSRCGRFSRPRNFGRLLSLQPYQALRVKTKRNGYFHRAPQAFPPSMENKNGRATFVAWGPLVLPGLRKSVRIIRLAVTKAIMA